MKGGALWNQVAKGYSLNLLVFLDFPLLTWVLVGTIQPPPE